MFNLFSRKNKHVEPVELTTTPQQELTNSLELAESLIINNNHGILLSSSEHPIYLMINTFAMGIQSKLIQAVFKHELHKVPIFESLIVPKNIDLSMNNIPLAFELNRITKKQITIDFSKDTVLSKPWHRDRITSTLSTIRRNEWKEDPNHIFEYLEPFKIASITNGMHSGTTGILLRQGTISKEVDVYDYSYLYDYIYTDGEYFYTKTDNQKISPVELIEEAIIFELGRLIVSYKQKGF